jgi:predicted esterase
VRAALAALLARFPDRVDPDRALYAGFSQGATMGALVFSRDPAPFAGALLIEGGAEEWSLHNARTFKAGGGRRVLFACGRKSCAEAARRSAGYLERVGVDARVVDKSGAGHTIEGPVREGVAEAFSWLVGDDPRWR